MQQFFVGLREISITYLSFSSFPFPLGRLPLPLPPLPPLLGEASAAPAPCWREPCWILWHLLLLLLIWHCLPAVAVASAAVAVVAVAAAATGGATAVAVAAC